MSRRPASTGVARAALARNRGVPGARMWSESPVNQHWSRVGAAGEEPAPIVDNCTTYPVEEASNYMFIDFIPTDSDWNIAYFQIDGTPPAEVWVTLTYLETYFFLGEATYADGEWSVSFPIDSTGAANMYINDAESFGEQLDFINYVKICPVEEAPPDPTVDLYPDTTRHPGWGDVTDYTLVGGTLPTIFSDNSDSTYVETVWTYPNGGRSQFEIEAYTPPVGKVVVNAEWQFRARVLTSLPPEGYAHTLQSELFDGTEVFNYYYYNGPELTNTWQDFVYYALPNYTGTMEQWLDALAAGMLQVIIVSTFTWSPTGDGTAQTLQISDWRLRLTLEDS